MTQQLKVLLDLPESLSWGASTYSKQFATHCNSSPGRLYTIFGLHGPLAQVTSAHTHKYVFLCEPKFNRIISSLGLK